MKQGIRLLFLALILFAGWKLFPDIFIFRDIQAVVITTIIMCLLAFIFVLVMVFALGFLAFMIMDKSPIMTTIILTTCSILSSFIFYIVSISLISKFYDGFTFNGNIWQLFLTSFIFSIITSDSENHPNKNQ